MRRSSCSTLVMVAGFAALVSVADAGQALRVHVREEAVKNPDLVHQWSQALRAELERRPDAFKLVETGEVPEVAIVVKSCLVDTRADDGVQVWHVKGYIQTHDGYAGILTRSYEGPKAAAVIKDYVDQLPDEVRLIREVGSKLPPQK